MLLPDFDVDTRPLTEQEVRKYAATVQAQKQLLLQQLIVLDRILDLLKRIAPK